MTRNANRWMIVGLSLLGASLLGAAPAFAGLVTPKKGEVSILKGPEKGAAIVATMKEGEDADALERKGMYWLVDYKGKKGFVSILQVNTKPDGNSAGLSKAIRNVAKDSRSVDDVASARSRSAVMGVRGLDESDSVGSAGDVTPNLHQVYAMEDREVPKKSIQELGDQVFKEVERRVERAEP